MIRDNKGMTMIEVLMGFTILVLFLAGMSGIIAFSNNIVLRSVDLRKDMEVIQSEMYKTNPIHSDIAGAGTIKLVDSAGGVDISLNKAKVVAYDSDDMKNNGASISDEGLGIIYYSVEVQ